MTRKKSPPDALTTAPKAGTADQRNTAPADRPGPFSLLGTASAMGLHMVTGPAVGAGLGWLADRWLDSWPAGAAIGLLLGVAAGFRNVWADARYLIRAQEPGPGARPAPDSAPGATDISGASHPHPDSGALPPDRGRGAGS